MKYMSPFDLDIRLMLVNKKEVTPDIVHRCYLGDIAIVYYIVAPETVDGLIPVTYSMAENWGVGADILFQHVKKSMEKCCPHYYTRFSLKEETIYGEKWSERHCMYCLTNKGRLFGASTLLYGDTIKKLANNSHADFYILPSSKHELCLITTDGICFKDLESYKALLIDNNRDNRVVSEADVLSDDVLYYSRAKDEIMLAEVAYESKDR